MNIDPRDVERIQAEFSRLLAPYDLDVQIGLLVANATARMTNASKKDRGMMRDAMHRMFLMADKLANA